MAELKARETGKRAKMWGTSIVGYGSYHYSYASGREAHAQEIWDDVVTS